MSSNRPSTFERLRYWQGQKLLGRDFRDQRTNEAQLRWWHNRALHNAFGVAYGLEVTPAAVAGEFSHVDVKCGVAYDCFGRELILQTTRRIALPGSSTEKESEFTLVVSYKKRCECGNKEHQLSDCAGQCCCRREEADFEWKATRDLGLSDGVPLAQIKYELSKPTLTEGAKRGAVLSDDFSPHLTRGLARPRIGRGATLAGDTAWDPWIESMNNPRGPRPQTQVGMQVTIDTSAAGFTQVPCYFAWLQGSLWNKTNIEFFPVPLTHIDSEGTERFRFRLWMPSIVALLGSRLRFANIDPSSAGFRKQSPAYGFPSEFVNFARQQGLYVCWIGIQEQERISCEPMKDCECETTSNHPTLGRAVKFKWDGPT